MAKVISEHPESSTSLFALVSDVFKDLATRLKLVNQVDHVNQLAFFSLPLYAQNHPCMRGRILLFMSIFPVAFGPCHHLFSSFLTAS